ncbi:EAL domain-containing protein [Pseudodesulfovibrio sp.]|uniref:EAL domain-containing protein n=1 Tax=Pseudodesulfovibrio sp. TaxID=2035812 RepID=UPI002623F1D1|nr:EAL domain-containing protein [Pseudodesulfovibrio sp.]MDD3311299.1 EAL domain-containing protein [Pseudodesulfovibrio sp.]
MTTRRLKSLLRHTPFRILLPTTLMILLLAGSIFLYLLPSLQSAFMNYKKQTIFELTGAVIRSLEHLDREVRSGALAPQEARRSAREMIRSLRYGPEGKDYFWINDTSPRMIMHPYRADLEGKDLSSYRDQSGKEIFKEFVQIAAEKGGGFVNYYWQWKDHPERISHKMSYVREFKPWGWIVGTGIYVDDVVKEIDGYRYKLAAIFMVVLLVISALQFYVLRQTALTEERRVRVQSQREKLVLALREGEERYRTIADFAYDWELWIGVSGGVLYCSPSCERLTGRPPEAFFENPALARDIIIADDQPAWDRFMQDANCEKGDFLDFRIRNRDGEVRWINVVGRSVSGIGMKPLGIRCSMRDITGRKKMEEQLRHQALHDPLTGLANRTLCLDRIGQAMHRAARRPRYFFAVIFLDLDRFKVINDSLGHRFGDMVLCETARRLTEHVRSLDTVSRFGGDEFVLLLDELGTPGEAIRIIKRIRLALTKPFAFGVNEVQTSASFGIVLSPLGDVRPADVLQNANIAMHQAKEAGRNRFKVFTERMLENAVAQLSLENDMRSGLDNGHFFIEYQPIMDLAGEDLMGFEALARWSHPVRGTVPPTEFIPLAEESGLIIQLGEWVLDNALKTLAEWRRETSGAEDVYMSVNLSSKQFARMELDRVVLDTLKRHGLPPEALKLEITESAIMDHPESAVRILNRLRKLGIRFSIDDFGTGYSSLSQLQQLPVDTLKVDRSFISRMKTDPENMEIVKAVIALAHSLDLEVVAEGVEEPDQVCSLIDLQCESVQGFYFHRPLGKDEALRLMRSRLADDGETPKERMARVRRDCSEAAAAGKAEDAKDA